MRFTHKFLMAVAAGMLFSASTVFAQEAPGKNIDAGQSLADAARGLLESANKTEPKEPTYTLKEISYYKNITIQQAVTHLMLNDPKIAFSLLNTDTQTAFTNGYPAYKSCVSYVQGEIAADKYMMDFYKKMTLTEPPKIDVDLKRRSLRCLGAFIPQKPFVV